MKVKNITSNKGNKIANQFIITDVIGNVFFQSYNSTIVLIDRFGNVSLDEKYWDYSRTTSKYRNLFLGKTTEQIKRRILDNTYILKDLN